MKLQRVLAILISTALITSIWIGGGFKSSLNVVPESALAQEDAIANPNRFQTGLSLIEQVNQAGYERSRDSLRDISPDLMRFAIEFGYGDVLSRPGLDIKLRQIATVAALTVLGDAQPQLKFHIQGALNVGCTRQEIIELITQMSVYAGFPKAINAMVVARDVFQELDVQGN